MALLTIYTPTYNREKLLPRVYDCLCRQTCQDFVWLIIDDGSTDHTCELVKRWIAEGRLNIQYQYKENGGVHTARDLAFHLCKTTLVASCDSDDRITDHAVEYWLEAWEKYGGSEYAGIISVAVDENGNRVTDPFPKMKALSYQDYTYKYCCGKEKDTVLNAEIVSKLPNFPVFEGEKLVGEGYKWIQLPQDKPFLLLDKVTRIYEQQPDGYVKNVVSSRFKNPRGFQALYRQRIISSKYLRPRIKGHIGYIAFSMILKDKHFIRTSPNPIVTALLVPFGTAVYLRFLYQRNRTKK